MVVYLKSLALAAICMFTLLAGCNDHGARIVAGGQGSADEGEDPSVDFTLPTREVPGSHFSPEQQFPAIFDTSGFIPMWDDDQVLVFFADDDPKVSPYLEKVRRTVGFEDQSQSYGGDGSQYQKSVNNETEFETTVTAEPQPLDRYQTLEYRFTNGNGYNATRYTVGETLARQLSTVLVNEETAMQQKYHKVLSLPEAGVGNALDHYIARLIRDHGFVCPGYTPNSRSHSVRCEKTEGQTWYEFEYVEGVLTFGVDYTIVTRGDDFIDLALDNDGTWPSGIAENRLGTGIQERGAVAQFAYRAMLDLSPFVNVKEELEVDTWVASGDDVAAAYITDLLSKGMSEQRQPASDLPQGAISGSVYQKVFPGANEYTVTVTRGRQIDKVSASFILPRGQPDAAINQLLVNDNAFIVSLDQLLRFEVRTKALAAIQGWRQRLEAKGIVCSDYVATNLLLSCDSQGNRNEPATHLMVVDGVNYFNIIIWTEYVSPAVRVLREGIGY